MIDILKRLRVSGIVLPAVLIGVSAVISAPALIKLTGGAQSGAQAATTLKTRTASCPGVAFFPESSDTDYDTYKSLRMRTSTNGGAAFWCNADLPNKATVTKVVFDVVDISSLGYVNSCSLFAIPVNASGASAVIMASVPSTLSVAMPGRVLLTDTTISGNPTNNGTTGYALICYLETGGDPDFPVGLFGASITYTITAGNG